MGEIDSSKSMKEIALHVMIEDENKRKNDSNETRERSILVAGSKGTGKTTMIYRFLEKDDLPRPTIAMDYSFGRKAGKSLVKNIAHVWEIGYHSSSLISAAMRASTLTHSPHHTTILIILDLSKPEGMWSSLEEIISATRSALKISYTAEMIEDMKRIKLKDARKDLDIPLDPFPMKMCIIGSRYDEFKEIDAEKRVIIGKCLRAVAHSLGAALYYHSAKDKTLLKRTRDLLSHYGFGSSVTGGKCTDYDKPLAIPAGADSYSSIGLKLSATKSSMVFDAIKQIFIVNISQTLGNHISNAEDPSNDPNFNEPLIDKLRSQKEEVINILLQDMLEGQNQNIPIPDPF